MMMMRKKQPQNNQSGFTLIEIVISFSILVLVVGVAYSALNGIIQAKLAIDDGREAQAIAGAVLNRMTRELQLAEANTTLLPESLNKDDRYQTSVSLLGLHDGRGSERLDSLSFMARGASQYVLGAQNFSGVVKLGYRAAEDPQSDKAEGVLTLVRSETPDIRPLKKAFDRQVVFPVTNRLVSLRFRYFDAENDLWLDEWGNDQQHVGLPAVIELTLKLKSPAGVINSYTTAVPLSSKQTP